LSNLPLDVLNLSTANGAQIIQWTATGASNQQFSLTRLK
ncbi:MAG: beta-xylosidase, partial [Cellvibrio sp.]|nr:beta-xylosidase [Cellvibrio sp.]